MEQSTQDAYFAGLFDGEGCIGIQMAVGRTRKRPMHHLRCSVSMVSPEPVLSLRDRYGGYIRKEPRRLPRRSMTIWTAHTVDAYKFLREAFKVAISRLNHGEDVDVSTLLASNPTRISILA